MITHILFVEVLLVSDFIAICVMALAIYLYEMTDGIDIIIPSILIAGIFTGILVVDIIV